MLNIPKNMKLKNIASYCIIIIIVGMLIILPVSNTVATDFDNPITTLGNGNPEDHVIFPDGGGTNDELNLTLPACVIVTEAVMELRGLAVQGALKPYLHDFQDTTNNNAWKDMTNQHPPVSAPNTFTTFAFINTEYVQIRNSDNIRAQNSAKGLNNYPYHLFRFTITEAGISYLNVYWEGYGLWTGVSVWPYWAYVYIWNDNTNNWELVGSNNTNINPIDFVIQKNSFTNPGDYIDSSDQLYVMAQGPVVVDMNFTSDIYTDYVKIDTLATGISYPTEPTLDIGGDGDTEWSKSSKFDTNELIGNNYNFKSELQSLVDAAEPGCEVVDVPLKFTSTTAGKIKISNITIDYEYPEINLAPELHEDIPGGCYEFYEDTDGGDKLIDLSDYFRDDRDNGSLIYAILKNNEDLHAEVDDDGHHLNFTASKNYFGTLEFQVRAFDKGLDGVAGGDTDLYTDSNIFSVTVLPTNDAPVIDSVGGMPVIKTTTELEFPGAKGAVEDEWYNLTVTGYDIDGDTLSFSTNVSFMQPASIEVVPDPELENTAQLSILATNDYVGILHLNLTACDNNATGGSSRSETPSLGPRTGYIGLLIEILNSNDAPELDSIGAKTIDEEQWLNFTITATDDDLVHGDKLEFYANLTTAIDGLVKGENYEFNKNTGEVSILPDNEMVGSYWVEFGVKDSEDSSDIELVKIIVDNVNDLPVPVISSPLHQEAFNTTTLVYFDGANSTDDDLIHGDSLEYRWNSDIFGTLSTEPQFEMALKDTGWHNITLTVTDSSDEDVKVSVAIKLAVAAEGDPGDGPDDPDGIDDTSDITDIETGKEEETGAFFYGIIIAVIMVIVVLIAVMIFLWQRKKTEREVKRELEELNAARVTELGAPPAVLPPLMPIQPPVVGQQPPLPPIGPPPMVVPPPTSPLFAATPTATPQQQPYYQPPQYPYPQQLPLQPPQPPLSEPLQPPQ